MHIGNSGSISSSSDSITTHIKWEIDFLPRDDFAAAPLHFYANQINMYTVYLYLCTVHGTYTNKLCVCVLSCHCTKFQQQTHMCVRCACICGESFERHFYSVCRSVEREIRSARKSVSEWAKPNIREKNETGTEMHNVAVTNKPKPCFPSMRGPIFILYMGTTHIYK